MRGRLRDGARSAEIGDSRGIESELEEDLVGVLSGCRCAAANGERLVVELARPRGEPGSIVGGMRRQVPIGNDLGVFDDLHW